MTFSHRLVLAIGAFAVLGSTAAVRARDSAMFRADAAHIGVYHSAAPRLDSVKWRFHAKGKIFASPTVSDGSVFVGSTGGGMYAVRIADGAELWHFATKGAVNSTAAVSGGAVFFSSADGNVYAVNERDGSEKWRFRTAGEHRFTAPGIHGLQPRTELMPDPFDVFLSSPAVWNGTVYIGSGDQNVYALNADTGALRWKLTTGNIVRRSPGASRITAPLTGDSMA